MILTPPIIARLVALGLVAAVAGHLLAKMDVFEASPDFALLVVISLGLLGGSLTGAVAGFSIGLLIDCLLLQTLGAFALTMLTVGYVAGRYRERRAAAPVGSADPRRSPYSPWGGGDRRRPDRYGVDADVSFLVVRDAVVKSLIGAVLAVPVLLLVRLVVRPALIDERRASRRRPVAPRTAETQ